MGNTVVTARMFCVITPNYEQRERRENTKDVFVQLKGGGGEGRWWDVRKCRIYVCIMKSSWILDGCLRYVL